MDKLDPDPFTDVHHMNVSQKRFKDAAKAAEQKSAEIAENTVARMVMDKESAEDAKHIIAKNGGGQ